MFLKSWGNRTARNMLFFWGAFACLCAPSATGAAPAASSGVLKASVIGNPSASGQLTAVGEPSSREPIPLGSRGPIRRVVIGSQEESDVVGTDVRTANSLVYSNTFGEFVFSPGPDSPIADDLSTMAVDGCVLASYLVRVTGGGDGSGPPFTANLALFDDCPLGDGGMIVRTDRTVQLPDDGLFDVIVDVSVTPVIIPHTIWAQVSFDSPAAGWVVGVPAELGFSADAYDHPHGPCVSWFRGWPRYPHASFYAQVFALGECPTEFPAYRAYRLDGPTFPAGADVLVADDLTLDASSCELASYAVGIITEVSSYTIDFELREGAGPGDPIPGTLRTYEGNGDGTLEIARFTFEPGIHLPPTVWMTWRPNQDGVGVVVAGTTEIGSGADLYALFNQPEGPVGWSFHSFDGDPPAVFFVSINCHGTPPTGACCLEAMAGEVSACVDDVTHRECDGDWVEGAACADEPFTPPCGAHSCCLPGELCVNLTEAACSTEGGFWQPGTFCGRSEQSCPPFACLGTLGDCFSPSEELHCANDSDCPDGRECEPSGTCTARAGCCMLSCCATVCAADPFCCYATWDELCTDAALAVCQPPVSNDECWTADPDRGALEIELGPRGAGHVETDNRRACVQPTDPGFCCSNLEPEARGFGTVWYKFEATHGSARLHTCNTAGEAAGNDSLLQVFAVADPTSDETSCNTKRVIGCNDDGECGPANRLSDLCVTGLTPGETYYVLLASRSPLGQGVYRLDLESPCPTVPQSPCPDGAVAWLDPPDGVIDARQPHEVDDAAARLGINQLTVRAPRNAGEDCWSLREAGNPGEPNTIVGVDPNGDGTYTIRLDHPLRPGFVTSVTYMSASGCCDSTGHFAHLPADTNADGMSDARDISMLVDCCLNQTCSPPFGDYTCDIDQSRQRGARDVIRLIDLLNGAGNFEAWLGRSLGSD